MKKTFVCTLLIFFIFPLLKPFRPFILTIYNLIPRDEAGDKWKAHKPIAEIYNELEKYYREPQEFFIPDQDAHPARWSYQIR